MTGKSVDVQEVRERLGAVTDALHEAELWDVPRPEPDAFQDMGAFGERTMSFSAWLRWVFVPRVEEALAAGGPWPESSSVSVKAAREGDTNPAIASLVDALSRFDELFWADETAAAAKLARSVEWLAKGWYAGALAENRRALQLHPRLPNVQNHLGYVLLKNPERTPADLEEAVALFREAHARAPQEVTPVANLAEALVALGRADEAISSLQRISRAQPEAAAADNWLGWYLNDQGQLDAALPHLERAVARKPHWGRARLNLAWLLHRRGDLDRALSEYEAALAAGGELDVAFAHAKRAELLEARGCPCNALEAWRAARRTAAQAHVEHYAAQAARLEALLAERGIPAPREGIRVSTAWLDACHDELPPERAWKNEAGAPLDDQLVAVELLLREGQFDAAAAAMQAACEEQPIRFVDGIGLAQSGARRARAAGRQGAAIALLTLAHRGLEEYVAMSQNPGQAEARRQDAERVAQQIADWTRSRSD